MMIRRLYDLICINDKTGRRVLFTAMPTDAEACYVQRSKCTAHAGRRLAVVETLTWNDEGEEMETYEILTHEPGFEGEVLGHIEHHPGSGAAVLKLHGHDVPVLHYASVGMALRYVRLCYGYSNAYVQKVREVAA